MGQTKKKRKRKHRGTPAGTVEARGRTSRPAQPAKGGKGKGSGRGGGDTKAQSAADRRVERLSKPPTWRSALNRSLIAAALFAVVVVLAFGESIVSGIALASVMILIYLPMTYYMDLFMHKRFKRKMEAREG